MNEKLNLISLYFIGILSENIDRSKGINVCVGGVPWAMQGKNKVEKQEVQKAIWTDNWFTMKIGQSKFWPQTHKELRAWLSSVKGWPQTL